MKTNDKLLNDVLADEAYRSSRSEIRAAVMRDVQRRRAWSTWTRRALALAACVPLAAVIYVALLRQNPPGSSEASTLAIVRTQPLRDAEIVKTAKAASSTDPGRALLIVKSGGAEFEIVRTSQSTEELSDQELLDLFKGQPVALVTVSAHERHLIILDSEQGRSLQSSADRE